MKSWNFIAKSNPKEISEKLRSALGSSKRFAFKTASDENNSTRFKVRKRILYGWYLKYHNSVVVNGELLKTNSENETDVRISFTQHFLVWLVIGTYLFMGLCWIVLLLLGFGGNPPGFIAAGIFLAIGIVLWIYVIKKFEKDTQTYKNLISEILEY